MRIKQHDITDCGAACLVSVASHYKKYVSLAKVRHLIGTDREGSSVLGLVQGAQNMGFDAKGVKGQASSLYEIPLPAIAHLSLKNGLLHYVVIYKVHKNQVRIMDPATGNFKKVGINSFLGEWTGVLLLLLPNESFIPGNERIMPFLRFWYLLKPHRTILVLALIGSVFYTLLGFSTSIYIQKITDQVLPGSDLRLLGLMGTVMVLILFVQQFLLVVKDMFLVKTGQEIDARLILGYYRHLLKLPQQYFDTMRVGELLSRINDAIKIRVFINNTSLTLMVNSLIVLFSFLLMFTYYWKLGLLMMGLIPVYALIYGITDRLNKKTEREIMESSADLEGQLVESLTAIGTIKQFGLEKFMHLKTEKKFVKLLKIGYRSSMNDLFSKHATQGMTSLFTIALLWTGSHYVIDQELTTGELLSFFAIIGYFTGPVSLLISSNKIIQNALIAADRLFEILDLEIIPPGGNINFNEPWIQSIRLKNISFSYRFMPDIFHDLNATFQKGQITAVVGESGSGKSSLLHIILKQYPLKKGRVLLNGKDIAQIDQTDLNNVISIVPQKIHLFDGNILDNIALGTGQIDLEKIKQICRSIDLLRFIENLPKGFQTQLGENGAILSGGQKQKIAIARALYREPEVLLLDEATSSLDNSSDKALLETLTAFRNDHKMVIIVSHRLSNISVADKIIVLKEGKIVQEGVHEELVLNEGVYKDLWQKQFPSFS